MANGAQCAAISLIITMLLSSVDSSTKLYQVHACQYCSVCYIYIPYYDTCTQYYLFYLWLHSLYMYFIVLVSWTKGSVFGLEYMYIFCDCEFKADHTRNNFCCWWQGSMIVCACCVQNISWYMYVHSTSCFQIDRWSIFQWNVARVFHVQTVMLPCHQQQKLPRVWLATFLKLTHMYMYTLGHEAACS